jgi:hypothetical protein
MMEFFFKTLDLDSNDGSGTANIARKTFSLRIRLIPPRGRIRDLSSVVEPEPEP